MYMYAYNLQYSQICIYVYSRSLSLVSVSLTLFSLYPAGIPLLVSIVEASACAFLPPSSRLRSYTSFSAASFPCSASSATSLEAVARSVASLSFVVACVALLVHANNSRVSTTLLVGYANSQACTAFTQSLPCLC